MSRATIYQGCSGLWKDPKFRKLFLKQLHKFSCMHKIPIVSNCPFPPCRSKNFQMCKRTKFPLMNKIQRCETEVITKLQKTRETVFCPVKIPDSLFHEDGVPHKPNRIKLHAQKETGILNRSVKPGIRKLLLSKLQFYWEASVAVTTCWGERRFNREPGAPRQVQK